MLPVKFQEDVVFLYYDTHEHTNEGPAGAKENEVRAEKAKELLWEYLNLDKLPGLLRKELQLLYKMRKALKDADPTEADKLNRAIARQEVVVEMQRKRSG